MGSEDRRGFDSSLGSFQSCVENVGAAQRNTQQPLPGFVAAPCPDFLISCLAVLYLSF